MLILRRKKNESILIGDHIRITVLETAADGVRLAIDAPRQMSILREELSGAEEANRASSVLPDYDAVSKLQNMLLGGKAEKNSAGAEDKENAEKTKTDPDEKKPS